MFYELLHALDETLLMVLVSGFFTLSIGLPLGILLYLLSYKTIFWQKTLYRILNAITQMGSTIPYLVLGILLIPLLRKLFGTEAGVIAAILPLSLAAILPFSRDIKKILQSLPAAQQDLARSIGISRQRWVLKISLKEVLPKIIQRYGHQLNQLMGYSIIAGVFGAGGLGGLLIEKGYQNFQFLTVLLTVIVLVVLIEGIRFSSQFFSHDRHSL